MDITGPAVAAILAATVGGFNDAGGGLPPPGVLTVAAVVVVDAFALVVSGRDRGRVVVVLDAANDRLRPIAEH